MANKEKKKSYGTSMGISSILAILVILVLVVFSTLSITTAKADLHLSTKAAESISNFYKADSNAEERYAEIATAVASGPNWATDLQTKEYEIAPTENGETMISYSVEIDRNRNLHVEILAAQDGKLSKRLWQIAPSGEWVPDTSLNVRQ